MEEEKISRTQLMALLWAGVMAPAAELLPALLLSGAGKGAWLAVVLAAPLVLAAGGYVIDAARGTPRSPGFYLSRQDCNELAMLTRPGTKVTILRGKGEEP